MRLKPSILGLLVPLAAIGFGLRISAQQAARPATTPAARTVAQTASKPPATPAFDPNDLPPISYVCNSPGEENVMEDTPGKCPKSGRDRVPIRVDIAYKCLRGPTDIQEKPGKCRYDGLDRGPVTVSVFWTCKSNPDQHLLEPGTCADGSAREKGFEERAHGDHNPRHGGISIYMSEDKWHHIEGTLVAPDLFRVYFYNEFTKPVPPNVFSAFVTLANSNNVETGQHIPLTVAKTKDGNAMEARIVTPPAKALVPTTSAPVYLKLRVKFKPDDKDWVTDYQFAEYSKEPAAPPPSATAPARTGAAANPKPPQKQASATSQAQRTPTPSPSRPAPKAPATPPPPSPSPASGTSGGTSVAPDLSAGASFGAQEVLPNTTPELLALLKERSDNVASLLQEGNLGGVWFPAIGAKDVALALEENHVNELPDSQRAKMTSAVKQLTVVSWQIDAAGDLGNKEKLTELHQQFAAAVADIQSLYASAR